MKVPASVTHLYLPEYADDIFQYLKQKELKCLVEAGFLKEQTEVTSGMRGVVLDWLSEVADHLHMRQDTLFLSFEIFDNYLAKQQMQKKDLQLFGSTSLMIANKFEEIFPCSSHDLVYCAAKTFTNQNVLETETIILNSLGFNICYPTPFVFLSQYSVLYEFDAEQKSFAMYLSEISYFNCSFRSVPPSKISAAACVISASVFPNKSFCWDKDMTEKTGYKIEDLKPFINDFILFVVNFYNEPKKAVHLKFAKSKHSRVALKQIPDGLKY